MMARLRREGMVLRNMRNWFHFILKEKTEHIYYTLYFKIILLPKYLFFVL